MEKQPRRYKFLYTAAVSALWLVIVICVAVLPSAAGLPMWVFAALAMPPLALAVCAQYERIAPFWALAALFFAASLALCGTKGVPLFMLAFAGVLAAGTILRHTPNFLPVFLGGSSLYILGVIVGAALLVRAHYGVFDFRGAYAALERAVLDILAQTERFYAETVGEAAAGSLTQAFSMIRESIDLYITHLFIIVGSFLIGAYFWTIKAAQFLVRDVQSLPLVPVRLFIVQRSVAVTYLLATVAEMFSGAGDYYSALHLANTLLGYLFVLCGIGFVDTFLSRKMRETPRMVIKIVLFGAAIAGKCMFIGLTYTVLSVLGVLLGLSGNFITFRLKKQDKEDDDA